MDPREQKVPLYLFGASSGARVAIERVTDEVQGTHLLAYHLLVVEELQQVKVCDSHTKLVWEDRQSAYVKSQQKSR